MIPFRTKAAVTIVGFLLFLSCQKEAADINPVTIKVNVFFISTYAGSPLQGNQDGPALQASFKSPFGIAATSEGAFFLTDNANGNIRRISAEGLVETVTPLGSLNAPSGIEVGPTGVLYVCESLNNRIVKVTSEGLISELDVYEVNTDGTHVKAHFNSPNGIALAPDGSIYIADTFNHKIRKISPKGQVALVAGGPAGYKDGKCTEARFNLPFGITLDKDGSLYVADYGNHSIRKINADGIVSTVAGTDVEGNEDAVNGSDARFRFPTDLAIAEDGTIYIADYYNSRIRSILTTGEVTTIAGTDDGFLDGVGITAKLFNPVALAIYKKILYITDSKNGRIRKIPLE